MTLTAEGSTEAAPAPNVGRIEAIQGVVIEAVFPDKLPEVYNAIKVRRPGNWSNESDAVPGL